MEVKLGLLKGHDRNAGLSALYEKPLFSSLSLSVAGDEAQQAAVSGVQTKLHFHLNTKVQRPNLK